MKRVLLDLIFFFFFEKPFVFNRRFLTFDLFSTGVVGGRKGYVTKPSFSVM